MSPDTGNVFSHGAITDAERGGNLAEGLVATELDADPARLGIETRHGLLNLLGQLAPLGEPGSLTDYSPSGLTTGHGITSAGGKLWLTDYNGNQIDSLTTSGTLTTYSIPTSSSQPEDIILGPDGNLWFTEYSGNKIGKMTTSGTFTEYSVPTSSSQPFDIAVGPDGNLWFTEYSGNKIGRITTAGTITEFSIPTGSSAPKGVTAGPDGNVWFTESAATNIGRITPTGTITEYSGLTSGAIDIALGSDNNLWFTEASYVGKYTSEVAASIRSNDPQQATSVPFGQAAIFPQNGNVQIADPLDFRQTTTPASLVSGSGGARGASRAHGRRSGRGAVCAASRRGAGRHCAGGRGR
jgi:sugar lactone lactonase YvrE